MINLVFATSNNHKVKEVNQILAGAGFNVVTMASIGCLDDIPETQPTIPGNALQKAKYLYQKYQVNCFSEDSGLEVDALNGAPGVFSARYAAINTRPDPTIHSDPFQSPVTNNTLLLKNLSHLSNRSARFRTVIALILNGATYLFEGVCEGKIAPAETGSKGFGYDPLFIPTGFSTTFAEMDPISKNEISHRGKAFRKMEAFLKNT